MEVGGFAMLCLEIFSMGLDRQSAVVRIVFEPIGQHSITNSTMTPVSLY